jgi:hypothetical protein
VAIVIADRVAGLPPTDPLDHKHVVTLPQPLLALGPSANGDAYACGQFWPLPTSVGSRPAGAAARGRVLERRLGRTDCAADDRLPGWISALGDGAGSFTQGCRGAVVRGERGRHRAHRVS